MKEFWNQRYAEKDFAYGTKPNNFFKTQLDRFKPGKILLPAEGEGRNAVYAALKGWDVFAFDISDEAKKKADSLSERLGVEINYTVTTVNELNLEENYFDLIALIFAHFPADKRKPFHQILQRYLKPEGTLLVEGFSENQFNRSSGGPKNKEMLFTIDQLRNDFNLVNNARIIEEEVMLNEGLYHQGLASVIQFIGKRNK